MATNSSSKVWELAEELRESIEATRSQPIQPAPISAQRVEELIAEVRASRDARG